MNKVRDDRQGKMQNNTIQKDSRKRIYASKEKRLQTEEISLKINDKYKTAQAIWEVPNSCNWKKTGCVSTCEQNNRTCSWNEIPLEYHYVQGTDGQGETIQIVQDSTSKYHMLIVVKTKSILLTSQYLKIIAL